jgi:hypothetical protein
MSAERWKPISEFPDYEVSDHGRVRRVTSRTCARAGHVLSSDGLRAGYPSLQLCRDGKRTSLTVHGLVASAFIGPCPPGHEVNHINGDNTYNHAANLEYVTRRENELHAYRLGLHDAGGERNGQAKLTREAAAQIREIASRPDRPSYPSIGRMFGVTEGTIRHVVNGGTWQQQRALGKSA